MSTNLKINFICLYFAKLSPLDATFTNTNVLSYGMFHFIKNSHTGSSCLNTCICDRTWKIYLCSSQLLSVGCVCLCWLTINLIKRSQFAKIIQCLRIFSIEKNRPKPSFSSIFKPIITTFCQLKECKSNISPT